MASIFLSFRARKKMDQMQVGQKALHRLTPRMLNKLARQFIILLCALRFQVILISFVMSSCVLTNKNLRSDSSDGHTRSVVDREITLGNGLKVLFIENKSLPYLSLAMMVRVGSRNDPLDSSGLTDVVADLLDKGTSNQNAVQIADSLEQYAGSFDASVGNDATLISANALSMHQDKLLAHFASLVSDPSFSQEEIERLKKRRAAQLKQLTDNPESMTDLAFEKFIYFNHPYANPSFGSMSHLKNINKKNVTKHYLTYFRPSNSTLAIVGKYSDDLPEKLEAIFGKWQDRKGKPSELVSFPSYSGQKIRLIDKKDLSQSQIRIGHEGVPRNHPEVIKLRLANSILGSGFTSRLMEEVRVKRGLTYSIHSIFDMRKEAGHFEISTFTRHEKVAETLRVVLETIESFKNKGVTEKELADGKATLKGQFLRSLETPEALATNVLYLRLYGVDDSFLKTYITDVESVTLQDLNLVIKSYFKPENLKILIHAPKDKVLEQLQVFGATEVKTLKEVLE